MRVLVTGGAGFLGSHVVEGALAAGHDVHVLDNFSTGQRRNLADVAAHPRLTVAEGSILDEALVRRLVSAADVVIHLAALVGPQRVIARPLETLHTAVSGGECVLRLSTEHGVKVVLASSSEVYGKSRQVPFQEHGDRVYGSTAVTRWCYAAAKAIEEHYAYAYQSQGLRFTVLRYFNVYGPRFSPESDARVVPAFILRALRQEELVIHGDGSQTRSFTYVDDAVRATLAAATTRAADGEVLNIGSAEETSILTLAETIKRLADSRAAIRFIPYREVFGAASEEMPRRLPDVSRAQEKLGFTAAIPLEEGLARTIAWAKADVMG